ncbi:hypothetical protein PPERSA_06717 [Pseudocohnilembus persalinus]|uniref:Uncharacterized protein n=1 Tax=Pseudocohnilembus persalinus TaxID=266149 RepID=A0A0V0QS25_PSEPJ|nr:hypothetical protein PPERSA_06717 [Pseudocohnilembus persalinus]|eukprot:KRX05083.1 hypothetical protein PPERSA_06717 [Pseudocohnilembus persalinus]
MSKELKQLVEQQKDEFEFLENGKIKCILTGHESMPDIEVFQKYLQSKSYKMAKEKQYDFEQHEPYLVQHKSDSRYMFCQLTGTKLIKRKTIIDNHVKGRKFQKLKKLFEEQEEERRKKEEEKKKLKDQNKKEKDILNGDDAQNGDNFDIDNMLDQFAQDDEEQKAKKGKKSKKQLRQAKQDKLENDDDLADLQYDSQEQEGQENIEEEGEKVVEKKSGLWPWTINQMLTPKFAKHVRDYGFLQTYTRGHKANRHPHYIAGSRADGYVKCVGQDEMGNRYYQDWEADITNHRRWVEYSDYFLMFHANSDRVAPAYAGWLAYVYDDFPTRYGPSAFVRPIYQKPHQLNISHLPTTFYPQGAIPAETRMKFVEDQKNRSRQPWQVDAVKTGQKFQGKKLLNNKKPLFDDVLAYSE